MKEGLLKHKEEGEGNAENKRTGKCNGTVMGREDGGVIFMTETLRYLP